MAVDENVLESFKGLIEKESGSDTERFLKVGFGNSQSLDQFGRVRTSQPFDIFDNKNISSKNAASFDEVLVGAGSITYTRQTSSVEYSISETGLDRAMRQTRYLSYIPGKSQRVVMTGVVAGSATDDMFCVLRSSTSGSAVDTVTARVDWDDTVLGTGLNNPSGANIDFSKDGIFDISFQWLGAGRVSFNIIDKENRLIEVLTLKNSFINDNVYMRTGSLPMRYEIVSDGVTIYRRIGYFDDNDGLFFESQTPATVGTHTMKEVCCSCSSEGGSRTSALRYHANARLNVATATTGGADVIAIKLMDSFGGNENRRTSSLMNLFFFAEDQNATFEVYQVTDWTDTGTVWTDVNTFSASEYSSGSNISITVNDAHLISCAVVAANASGSKSVSGTSGSELPFELLDENRTIRQNYDSTQSQIFLVRAFTFTGTTTADCGVTWLEVE